MENKNGHFSLNKIKIIIFLIKTPKKHLINVLKKETFNKNSSHKERKKERQINQINYIKKMHINSTGFFNNEIIDNKIIFVEPIKSWRKYGLESNAHSLSLFNELKAISINDFSFEENANKNIFNMVKSRIKKIKENGSSMFCALFFNKELNKMISVSVGNILYSILRENKSRKYEIIYISTEQYHEINIPFQISSLNQDYDYLNIQCHNINVNDIIIISNKKKYNFLLIKNNEIKNYKNFLGDEKKRNGNSNNPKIEFKISEMF
jgi:hypothetical protein